MILRRNNRIPTQEFVLHFLKVLSAKDIMEYRTKIFRILTDNGLEAVANIELTKGKNGKPNNTVHFHFLTDDKRREKVLQKLFETACERQNLVKDKDFCMTHRNLYDGYGYFDYFTKYGYSDKVILFRKDVGLQKFYQIGQWFKESKKTIWKEYTSEKYGNDSDKTNVQINDIFVNGSQQVEQELLPQVSLTEKENDMNENLELQRRDIIVFDRQTWYKDIRKIQSILTGLERLPDLYSSCGDLIGRSKIENMSLENERELLELLKDKYNRVVKQIDQKLMCKHNCPEPDASIMSIS